MIWVEEYHEMYKLSGISFEEKLFGSGDGGDLWSRFGGSKPDFDSDVREILKSFEDQYPQETEAYIGRALHHQMERVFKQTSFHYRSLRLVPAVGTKPDLFHGTDGVLVLELKTGRMIVITLDAFNFDKTVLGKLRDYWIDVSEGHLYSESAFHGDLFRFKRMFSGVRKCLRGRSGSDNSEAVSDPDAVRTVALWILSPEFKAFWEKRDIEAPGHFVEKDVILRPENHFVVTPRQVGNYRSLRAFAKMLATYFIKEAKKSAGL